MGDFTTVHVLPVGLFFYLYNTRRVYTPPAGPKSALAEVLLPLPEQDELLYVEYDPREDGEPVCRPTQTDGLPACFAARALRQPAGASVFSGSLGAAAALRQQ